MSEMPRRGPTLVYSVFNIATIPSAVLFARSRYNLRKLPDEAVMIQWAIKAVGCAALFILL